MDGKEFLDILKSRRSVKNFINKDISDQDLTMILEAGQTAPTSLNLQPYRFLVVKDKHLKKELSQFAFQYNEHIFKVANYLIFSLVEKNIMNLELLNDFYFNVLKIDKEKYPNRAKDIFDHLKKDVADKIEDYDIRQSYFPILNMVNQATALNIGSTIMEGINRKKLTHYLENLKIIEKNRYIVFTSIALGYKTDDQPKIPWLRKSLEDMFIIIK